MIRKEIIKQKTFLISILAAGCLAGCAGVQKSGFVMPNPVVSEYFRTTAGAVLFTLGTPPEVNARYEISLKILKPLPAGAYLETFFEDPQNSGTPLMTGEVLVVSEGIIKIVSPVMTGFKFNRGYLVQVDVYESRAKRKFLGLHRQTITSFYDAASVQAMNQGVVFFE